MIVMSRTRIGCFLLTGLPSFGCFAELEGFFRRLDLATSGNPRMGVF